MARQGSSDRLRGACALDFQWHAEPIAVVCAFPYIVAFTEAHTIEVRLIINGSLVHSILLPHLQFITAKVLHIYCILYTVH